MSNLEGVMLSDYLLLECISRGNVADVYRARQNGAGQYEVAVKVFRPNYAEREAFRTHFMYEAEKVGQFDHPHILPFIEYGEGEGLLYAVTPFVKSGTLKDLLKKVGGKFPAMQVLPIVQQLCDAVQYAHEHDVIHGNLKPGNVFVANDGRMLLADFGIARSYAGDQQALARMEWSATEYVAPEQSLGLLRRTSDVYALGALFFRLLTGSPVFAGQTSVEVLLKHVRQEPPSARALDTTVSDAVDEVLRKALSKRAEDRYQAPAELSQAFTTAVSLAPVASPVARPVNLTTRPLLTPVPEPPLPAAMPAPSMVEQPAETPPTLPLVAQPPKPPSAPLQFNQTAVIALPVEFQQSEPQPPVLPEQHGGSGQTFSEPHAVREPDYAPAAGMSPYWSLEPVEWSPIIQISGGGEQAKVADYYRRNSQTLPAPEPQPAIVQSQQTPQKDERGKHSLFLPILIVVLLLLGLLGALISSFLFPAPSGSSGMRDLPNRVVYQADVVRW